MNDTCVLIPSHITCIERIESLIKCINSLKEQTINFDILLSISFENRILHEEFIILMQGISKNDNIKLKFVVIQQKYRQFQHLLNLYQNYIYYNFVDEGYFTNDDNIMFDQTIQYKYILFCDDDDYYQNTRVEKMVSLMRQGYQCVCETNHYDEYEASINYHEYVYYGININLCATFFNFIKRYNKDIFEHKFCDLLLSRFIQNKILDNSQKCAYIFEKLYIQNRHFYNSVTSRILKKNKENDKEIHSDFNIFIKRLNEDLNNNIHSIINNIYPMFLIKELSLKNMIREQLRINYKYYKLIDQNIIETMKNEYKYVESVFISLMNTQIENIT